MENQNSEKAQWEFDLDVEALEYKTGWNLDRIRKIAQFKRGRIQKLDYFLAVDMADMNVSVDEFKATYGNVTEPVEDILNSINLWVDSIQKDFPPKKAYPEVMLTILKYQKALL